MQVVRIPLAETKRFGGREVDAATVSMLKESLAAVGLLNPITVTKRVRNDGPTEIDTFWIVAGKHRAQAARELGWTEIDALVVELDGPMAELCEIDENLVRAELTDAQRAKAHARRVHIMADLGLVREVGRPAKSRQNAEIKSYADATSEQLGVHPDTVRRDVRRGREIDDDVLQDITGTALDRGVVLDELAATPKAEQRAKLAEITLRRQEAERARKDAEKVNKDTDRVIAMTEAERFAEWLLGRMSLDEIPTLIAWLEVAKPKDVTAALRRAAA